jgi:hypothetical protein
MKEVCSPNSSGAKPKDRPLPAPPKDSRGVRHSSVYGDRRSDAEERAGPGPDRPTIQGDRRVR